MIAPAPLTTREEELMELKKNEVNTDHGIDSRHQTLGGVGFPITEAARQAITDMIRGSYNYLQFKIGKIVLCIFEISVSLFSFLDIEDEIIHLVSAENVNVAKLPLKVPSDHARYHLYRFKHTHEGDYTESICKCNTFR